MAKHSVYKSSAGDLKSSQPGYKKNIRDAKFLGWTARKKLLVTSYTVESKSMCNPMRFLCVNLPLRGIKNKEIEVHPIRPSSPFSGLKIKMTALWAYIGDIFPLGDTNIFFTIVFFHILPPLKNIVMAKALSIWQWDRLWAFWVFKRPFQRISHKKLVDFLV